MKALVGLTTVLYKSFPTSIQEDERALSSDSLEEGARLAVAYRLAAKRGLERAAKAALLRMKELGG